MHTLADSRRMVIKIGSALLVDPASQHINHTWLSSLIADIRELINQGKQVIIVSSGAIAIGKMQLGLPPTPLTLNNKQAAAAVGQIELTHLFAQLFRAEGLTTAQVLLTLGDTEDRRRYINLSNTLESLLAMGTVPIINENDSVATSEIRYGDNDRLAARVAQLSRADSLLLLSDIDGLYTDNPHRNRNATLIPTVDVLTDTHYGYAKSSHSAHGSGGMRTKLDAAHIAMQAGTHMLILSGQPQHPIRHYQEQQRGTWFIAQHSPNKAKKVWLSTHVHQRGAVVIDAGAAIALSRGSSLLPVGISAVHGTFDKGDIIKIIDPNGITLTCGISNYGSQDIQQIIGKHSNEITATLGYRGYDEVIHRDNLGFLTTTEGNDHDTQHD